MSVRQAFSLENLNIGYIRDIGNGMITQDLPYKDTWQRKRGDNRVVIPQIAALLPDFRAYDIDRRLILVRDDAVLVLPKSYSENILVFTKTIEVAEKLFNRISSLCSVKDVIRASISYFFKAPSGIESQEIKADRYDHIYPEFYPDIQIDTLLKDFTDSKECILILHGKPGTGKTSFVKYLISQKPNSEIGYAKDKSVFEDSNFWPTILNHGINLLVLDDLDFMLKARQDGDSNFMGNLLSFSDGILNNGTKIVITTNQKVQDIDAALLRPGRCFDFLILNTLSREQAKDIWHNVLGHDDSTFIFTSSEVTQAALMSQHQRVIKDRQVRSYIKADDNKYSLEKKIEQLGITVNNGKGFGFKK